MNKMTLTRSQQKAIFAKLRVKNNLRKTDPKFVDLMEKTFLETSPEIIKKIDSLTLLKKKKNQSVADVLTKSKSKNSKISTYDIRVRFDGKKKIEEFPIVYNHEIDHIFYDQTKKHNPKKIQQYKENVRNVIAFNPTLRMFFSDVKKQLKSGNSEKIEDALDLFFDEVHSETREATDRIKLGLDPAKFDQRTKDNLNEALSAYKKLHSK